MNEKIDEVEINVAFPKEINDDIYLMGKAVLKTSFDGESTSNHIDYMLSSFALREEGKLRVVKEWNEREISSLLKWLRNGNTSMYEDIIYIKDKEIKVELLTFIERFIMIDSRSFYSLKYNEMRSDYIKLLGELWK